MTQEKSPEPSEPREYTGRVLPGSRWLQRAFAGHTEQIVTVLRVGTRSVMLVIEGNPNGLSGHDRQKVGQRFNVVLETFLKTHTLLEQPKGYRPGDEQIPVAARKDTVETYFRRRRYAQEWIETMEGHDPRQVTTDPRLPIIPEPIYPGDAVLPPLAALHPMPTEPTETAEPTPPPEKEPEPMPPTETVETVEIPPGGYTPEEMQAILSAPDEPEPEPEPDPVQVFIDTGHGAVRQLTTEMHALAAKRDEYVTLAEQYDRRLKIVKVNRDRIEGAVLAAIAATEGHPEPEEEPEGPAPEPAEPVPSVPPVPPVPPAPHVQRHGPPPATSGTQRSWVLDRLAKQGTLHVGSVADEFAASFGLSRESAIKNMASILGDQVNRPAPQWPTAMRVGKGEYAVVLNG
jgi:hypothetical protein